MCLGGDRKESRREEEDAPFCINSTNVIILSACFLTSLKHLLNSALNSPNLGESNPPRMSM
jgi:hypothetical protein